jgi:hypothetical protein
MSGQITLTLPSDVLQRAELLARRAGRSVDEWLAETIELTLRPMGAPFPDEAPPTVWSDADVLAAADAALPPAEDQRLTLLLDHQQAGNLTDPERRDLSALMELYQQRLLRKAQAIREAVRRGLREPLQP